MIKFAIEFDTLSELPSTCSHTQTLLLHMLPKQNGICSLYHIQLPKRPLNALSKESTGTQCRLKCSIVVVHNAGAILADRGQAILEVGLLFLRLAVRIEVRAFGLAADTDTMAAVRHKAVRGAVVGAAVVPESNVVLVPLEADVRLVGRGDDLVEVRDDVVTLNLGNADNLGHEAGVEEQRLPSGDGVHADERVLSDDRLATDGAAHLLGAIGLHLGRVKGSQALEVLLHVW